MFGLLYIILICVNTTMYVLATTDEMLMDHNLNTQCTSHTDCFVCGTSSITCACSTKHLFVLCDYRKLGAETLLSMRNFGESTKKILHDEVSMLSLMKNDITTLMNTPLYARSINLSRNKLTTITYPLLIPITQHITLKYNKLRFISRAFEVANRLDFIDLSHNELTNLNWVIQPGYKVIIDNLHYLNLAYNKIYSLQELASALRAVNVNIRYLDMSYITIGNNEYQNDGLMDLTSLVMGLDLTLSNYKCRCIYECWTLATVNVSEYINSPHCDNYTLNTIKTMMLDYNISTTYWPFYGYDNNLTEWDYYKLHTPQMEVFNKTQWVHITHNISDPTPPSVTTEEIYDMESYDDLNPFGSNLESDMIDNEMKYENVANTIATKKCNIKFNIYGLTITFFKLLQIIMYTLISFSILLFVMIMSFIFVYYKTD